MGDVEDLKEVLNRIEGKLIAASKVYSALNFAMWEGIMILYYLIIAHVDLESWMSALYWVVAFSVAMYFTFRIWKRLEALDRKRDTNRTSDRVGMLTGLSWGIGALLGWFVIPMLNLGVNREASLAIGLLSFISISVFGMWLTFNAHKIRDAEMIPAFLVPVIGIISVHARDSGAMLVGGLFIALGFTLTVMWYLYSAFRAIEG